MIKMMLIAGAGGFAGTCCRFLVGKWCAAMSEGVFPTGTFLVNMAGCFMIGVLFGLLEKTDMMTAQENALLVTGFCGGFTTFSAFAGDALRLGGRGDWVMSGVYVLASVAVGVLLVWAGRVLVR